MMKNATKGYLLVLGAIALAVATFLELTPGVRGPMAGISAILLVAAAVYFRSYLGWTEETDRKWGEEERQVQERRPTDH